MAQSPYIDRERSPWIAEIAEKWKVKALSFLSQALKPSGAGKAFAGCFHQVDHPCHRYVVRLSTSRVAFVEFPHRLLPFRVLVRLPFPSRLHLSGVLILCRHRQISQGWVPRATLLLESMSRLPCRAHAF